VPGAPGAAVALPWRHVLLGLAVVAVWGSNFVVIKQALTALPPLTLAVLRFALAFLPAALFVKRPAVRWRVLALYGLFIGAGQFGLLYTAMNGHITPGLASLVVQSQVFLTIGLAMLALGERPRPFQWLALALAGGGIAFIAAMAALRGEAELSPLGVALVLLAALSWAAGNHTARAAGRVDMLAFVVWSSLFALPPLLLASLLLEGADRIAAGLAAADAGVWAAVVWQALGNSLFGYAAWGWLLARHPAASVAPLALGVPVFGMACSALWWGEAMPGWKLAAAALVIAGLTLNLLWPRWQVATAAART
jgi:O-acetylserine/cysteine efflux transporter